MTFNQQNLNISTINVLKNTNNYLGNVAINNSIKIANSALNSSNTLDHANAGIYIKDINSIGSGEFYPLQVNSLDYTIPQLYFNNNLVIDSTNLLNELEHILIDYPLETSNIIVNGGYINFFNGSITNTTQGADGVGIRYNTANNTMQFRNIDTDWLDMVDIFKHDQFAELIDVDVYTNPLQNNQYITYNATSQLFVNSNLSIINDTNPTLANDLHIGTNSLIFSNNINNIIYDNTTTRNPIILLRNNTTITDDVKYLEINNSNIATDPAIICMGTDSNIGINITTKGTGDIFLNASQGNIYNNADSIIISGFMRNSIYRTSSNNSYQPSASWTIPISTDTILFDFINDNTIGTYWANVSPGIDGQKLNLIFNNKQTIQNQISVLADFGTNGIIIGTGYSNGLVFSITGQSTSLIYLEDTDNIGSGAWQVLNTGSGVF